MTRFPMLHILVAMALAAVTVAMPMGYLAMIIPWIIVVVVACKRESKQGRGAITFATYVAVTAFFIVAAVFAPVKTMDRVLACSLTLPKTDFTLAEMDRGDDFENSPWLPSYVTVTTTSDNAGTRIRFRSTEITLREFVDTVESQSTLRHRFVHCGNGSSILYGGDCCFGLKIR